MFKFLVGIALGGALGGFAVWFWRDEIARYADDQTRSIRTTAADTLRAAGDSVTGMLDSTRDRVQSTVQAGEDTLRPATL